MTKRSIYGFNKRSCSQIRIFLISLLLVLSHFANADSEPEQRIISLSPHLTELVYALNKQNELIAVSDYSDFPPEASTLPSVASYQGANIAEIIRLAPTHILVWRGGNKDIDIKRLKDLGYAVHESNIDSVATFMEDLKKIGSFLDAQAQAQQLIGLIETQVSLIKKTYKDKQIDAIYYLNSHPLIGLGSDPWLNDLLAICGINNIYATNVAAYPQLQLSHIIRERPSLIIAATKASSAAVASFWQQHQAILKAQLIQVNPDALHRFTLRAIDETARLCQLAYSK